MVLLAAEDGEVVSVSGAEITVMGESGPRTYNLRKYDRSNQKILVSTNTQSFIKDSESVPATCLLTVPPHNLVSWHWVRDVVVAFLSWEGGNFEDAILVSENLVKGDKYTSVHVENTNWKHVIQSWDLKKSLMTSRMSVKRR